MSSTFQPQYDRLTSAFTLVLAIAVCTVCPLTLAAAEEESFIDIGTRRELFVDDYLFETLDHARRVLHHPTPARNIARPKQALGRQCEWQSHRLPGR